MLIEVLFSVFSSYCFIALSSIVFLLYCSSEDLEPLEPVLHVEGEWIIIWDLFLIIESHRSWLTIKYNIKQFHPNTGSDLEKIGVVHF